MKTTGKKVITRVVGLTYASCMDIYTNKIRICICQISELIYIRFSRSWHKVFDQTQCKFIQTQMQKIQLDNEGRYLNISPIFRARIPQQKFVKFANLEYP